MKIQLRLFLAAFILCGSVPAFSAVDAPQVTVNGDTLFWSPVDAITINVHSGEAGEWLESIPGDATQWRASAAGSYFIVGADRGEWQGWGKSNVVNVTDAAAHTGSTDFNSRTDSWTINSDTITFAVDGWFQVQLAGWLSDYPTVCEGVATCTLQENELYQVVNHSTGEVWQNVRVNLTDMTFKQIGLYGGQLYWNNVVYNHEVPIEFKVYLNGVLLATSNRKNIVLNNLARGTYYHATVYVVSADGSEELVGDQIFLTDGPSSDVVTYGRPAADRNTFGFEFWNDIEPENYNSFPSDCLFALPVGGYCFSPSTRYLMEYNRYAAEGSEPIIWEFALPGDNSTNHIEGLAHFYGTGGRRFGAPRRFALLADITTQFAQSRYEISVFEGSGTFLGTFPILEDLRFSAGDGQERQINLDGKDLRVALGPVRPRAADASVYSSLPPRRLHIAGEYYEPTGLGSLSNLSGWRQEGAFLAVVDANTGETLEKTFYSGMTVEDVPVD